MPGTRASYTMRTADVVVQYAADPRCVLVGYMPDPGTFPTIHGVYIIAHGGGWIAQTNSNSWKHEPTYELTAPDAFLDVGIAVYWMEYPYGWHAVPGARFYPSSRYPQIPRGIGQAVQFLKTHAADGYATGSVDIVLPTESSRYWLQGNSAGSIMAVVAALQPDGWLPYDPAGIPSRKGRFSYTHSHRVGGVFAYDCATDLRRYDGSPSAMPYYGPSGAFYGTSISSVVGLTSDRFASVDQSLKYASSPISLAEKRYEVNLDVVVLASNSIGITESSFLDSGVTIPYTGANVTGAHPIAGQAITSSPGGATGTVRAVQARAGDLYYLFIDGNAGAGDVLANWGSGSGAGSLTYSGGSISGISAYNALDSSGISGSDTYREFLDKDELLAIWDADDYRLSTVSEHSASYLPAFKRERDAHFAAAGLPSIDDYYIGNTYTASISGYTAAFPWNDIDQTTTELGILSDRGVLP